MLLSVLDQSPIRAGGTAADAVAETLELAQACDRWGYHRYWVAGHQAESHPYTPLEMTIAEHGPRGRSRVARVEVIRCVGE